MNGWGHSIAAWARKAVGPDASTVPDGELCARFAATRDQAAFELLVWRHSAMVLRTALAVTRDRHLAEDVSQAAFLVLAKRAGRLREPNAVAGFMHTTAHRTALRAVRLRRTVPLPAALPATPTPPDDDTAALLHDEVARLPAAWRAAVLLCFFEGLTHAEAAQRLGKPVGSVAGWVARAKGALHDRLTRRGVTLPAAGLTALASVGPADAHLVEAVTAASLAYAAGTPPASPLVLTLVTGATHAMFLAKLKVATVATAIAITGVGGTAGGLALVQAQGVGGPPGAGGPPLNPDVKARTYVEPKGPAVAAAETPEQAARPAEYKQVRRSQANLKKLLVAFHYYHDAFGYFPTEIQVDGKALLSWRVTILPYMGEEKLYTEFKLDEPWDSEHNLKLLSKMPDVMRVGFEPPGGTHTHYQVVAAPGAALFPQRNAGGMMGGPGRGTPGGTGMMPGAAGGMAPGDSPVRGALGAGGMAGGLPGFGGVAGIAPPGGAGEGGFGRGVGMAVPRQPKITDITDGLSNTIGVVECGPAVPWTKPADLKIADLNQPLPKLQWPFAGVFNVGMMDGSAYTFSQTMPEVMLRALMTAAGGEVVEREKFYAKIPATTAEQKALITAAVEEQRKLAEEILAATREYIQLKSADPDLLSVEATTSHLRRMLEEAKATNERLKGTVK